MDGVSGERRQLLLTPTEVAVLLRWEQCDPNLAKRRLRNIGPHVLPYVRIGRDRLYKEEDVVNFIESRKVAA